MTAIKERILEAMGDLAPKVIVMQLPNIVNFSYGRTPAYTVTEIKLGEELESISGTKIRKEMGIG